MVEELDKMQKHIMFSYREVLKTPSGRTVLQHILSMAPDYPYSPDNAYNTAFNCGQNSIATAIKERIYRVDSDALKQMRNEWNSMEKSLQKEKSEDIYG